MYTDVQAYVGVEGQNNQYYANNINKCSYTWNKGNT